MGVDVGKYKVVLACYVPVGTGLRYKYPGQVVMLSEDEAADLTGYVEPADQEPEDQGVAERNTIESEDQGVAERNTTESEDQGVAERNTTESDVVEPEVVQVVEGVTSDVGDPEAVDE